MTNRHVIEILYTERCRSLPLAVRRVRHALSLREDHLDVEIRLILVESLAEAVSRGFRGSPTVRIDDRDVHVVDSRIERTPSVASIRRALDDASLLERSGPSVRYVRRTTAPVVVEVLA